MCSSIMGKATHRKSCATLTSGSAHAQEILRSHLQQMWNLCHESLKTFRTLKGKNPKLRMCAMGDGWIP